MTIKHLGGIFGRNPTFNDVTVDGGIYFEDGQSGNYLDDYEEGTWTPAVGTSSNEVGTWDSSFDATYTKIGRTVMINLVISGTGMGFSSTTGNRQYTGLPFQPLDDGSGSYAASGLAVGGGVAVYASGSTFYLARHFGTGTASKIQISFAYKTTA